MLSEDVETLPAVLQMQSGHMLCASCVTLEAGCNLYEVRKAIRELILSLKCQAVPGRCSSCDLATVVVTLWRSTYRVRRRLHPAVLAGASRPGYRVINRRTFLAIATSALATPLPEGWL